MIPYVLSGHIVDIFNAILNSGVFPSLWSEGMLVSLFKKNDPNDVNNYRGITLVSFFSEIFIGGLNKLKRLKKKKKKNGLKTMISYLIRSLAFERVV